MNLFYYIRGVAPAEAREAIQGRNGRVSDTVALTNRGNDPSRLAFGMNEPNVPGINLTVVDEFIVDAHYYANLGAYIEAHPNLPIELQRDVHPKYRGFLLIFAIEQPLPLHRENLVYGNSWRTTSELPAGIERYLVGITPSAPMRTPSNYEDFQEGDFSLFGRQWM